MDEGLDRLNHGEQRVLRLLAQGHTAKSIAAIEGCSTNAVNERLRAARRKTGVGSSRELARKVVEQENRDEQFGLAPDCLPGASIAPQASSPASRRWTMPMLAMAGIAAVTLVFAAVDRSQPAVEHAESPAAATAPAHVKIGNTLDREPRDASWAAPIEAALDTRFAALAGLADRRVRCAATLCEVSGRLTATVGRNSPDSLMRDLQGSRLSDDLAALGLTHRISSFGSRREAPTRIDYVSYWMRQPAA
ncbi:helix-turn-helix domain-containing protein [Sphingomonas sp.]|uniref:helix-turn-helix domain-containing protein n=1 Tax=Sphingomonas sp. TaxID=28214 RepID=UPI002DD69E18|nr:helix-turn-helix transcriptional regulator [Sphingomonas sp.]